MSLDLSRSDSKTGYPMMTTKSPLAQPAALDVGRTPSKDQASPTKSSLSPSKFKSSFDNDTGVWSAESSFNERQLPSGRSLHRHAKSVTFDAAPPQVNEYEMATPDLSSIGTNSREGSYESVEDDYEEGGLYDPAHVDVGEDSFDASLEDTDKTPVVGPDDWRGDSPTARNIAHPQQYKGSPMPEGAPSVAPAGRPAGKRNDSGTSNGEHRPLPPLPGLGHARSQSGGSAPSSPRLSATAERMLGSQRGLPSPPPAFASKSDIQNIGNGKMTLEERLKLMMMSDDNGAKTAAEQQRERRLRRGGGRDRFGTPTSEPDESTLEAQEQDDTIGDISALDNYQPPSRISRESIMRRVNGNKALERESDFKFSSPAPSLSPHRSPTRSPERLLPLDPDIPIPSTEDSIVIDDIQEEGSVIITRNPEDEEDDVLDLYQHSDVDNDEEPHSQNGDDSGSHYSDNEIGTAISRDQPRQAVIDEGIATPRAATPDARQSLKSTLPDLGPPQSQEAFGVGMESFMAKMEEYKAPESGGPKMADAHAYLQRPFTPDQPISKPEYDGTGWGDPEDEYDDEGTPDSVIHHAVPEEEAHESPAIPERIATIKAPGAKLKTRPSNTPADLAAMREARRQVSYEVPNVPPIPERHRNRLSRNLTEEDETTGDDFLERHPSFKNRSLILDIDLGLSLDQDFDRVIEAQKVTYSHTLTQHRNAPDNMPRGQASIVSTDFSSEEINADIMPRRQRGYLMRQNTKLVAASDKEADESWKSRSAANSPVKQERPQSWTVEPWNGKVRDKSVRKRPEPSGPVPPLPGLESNARPLTQVAEEEPSVEMNSIDSGERGRLFVKVMGVKDLDLPLPKSKNTISC